MSLIVIYNLFTVLLILSFVSHNLFVRFNKPIITWRGQSYVL